MTKGVLERPPSKVIASVGGMTCAACVNTIESYLKSQPGILGVSVSLLAEKAEIFYDSAVITPSAIQEAITDVGYSASVVEVHFHCKTAYCFIGHWC